jgi:hypothetical protein
MIFCNSSFHLGRDTFVTKKISRVHQRLEHCKKRRRPFEAPSDNLFQTKLIQFDIVDIKLRWIGTRILDHQLIDIHRDFRVWQSRLNFIEAAVTVIT